MREVRVGTFKFDKTGVYIFTGVVKINANGRTDIWFYGPKCG